MYVNRDIEVKQQNFGRLHRSRRDEFEGGSWNSALERVIDPGWLCNTTTRFKSLEPTIGKRDVSSLSVASFSLKK